MNSGTPNSTTTSLSALSTTAIKDGHQGHLPTHNHARRTSNTSNASATTLDAERADRISRLAGLERVATARSGGVVSSGTHGNYASPPPGYFDNIPPHIRERSTVGSASATGSVGGRTTWASGSDIYDDKMSEDQNDDISSTGGFSDEGNASLVGFGEGASSTISGPTSTAAGRMAASSAARAAAGAGAVGSPTLSKAGTAVPAHLQHQAIGSPMSGVESPSSSTTSTTPDPTSADARHLDGMTYDANVTDTAARQPRPVEGGADVPMMGQQEGGSR